MLLDILAPRSVAILGASDSPIKAGGRPIDYMRRFGFKGDIYPVNPHRRQIQGMPSYRQLTDLPAQPDIVIVSVASQDVVQAIDDSIAVGARAAVIYSSGFAELGAAGQKHQQELVERARAGGVRLFGPNTQGIANFRDGAVLHFSTMINENPPSDGPVAIVSQSGAGSAIIYGGLRRASIGVRYMVATGNEADICAAEVVRAVVEDESIRAVLLYIEAMRNPDALAEAACIAHARDIPILAVKAGRTRAGQLTASSHTGSLAGEDALTDAFFRQHGIVRLADFHELIEYSALFSSPYRPKGRKVVSISNSGATCVLAADAAEDHGLSLCEFSPSTISALKQVLPSYVTARNPIDMTTALLGQPAIYGKTLETLAQQQQADMIHIGFPIGGEGYDFSDFSVQTGSFMEHSGIPVTVSTNQDWVSNTFRVQNVPVFGSERSAMRGLALLENYVEMRDALRKELGGIAPKKQNISAAAITLDEPSSLAALAAAHLPVVKHILCRCEADVRNAIAQMEGPLVAKGVSKDLAHKSEHKLVRLGIHTESEAIRAFNDFMAILNQLSVENGGMLLARQHHGDFELAIGAHLDPDYGPVVMVGQGGVLVEVLKDVQFLIAPFTERQASDALLRLRIAPAFGEVRGMPAVNLHRITAMLISLGDWMMHAQGAICSVDANPVIVARGDIDPVIVDAVVMGTGVPA